MNSAISVPEYLQLAADKVGFIREQYVEKDIPTTLGNVTVMPFFGDLRSHFVLSSLLLHRYLAEFKRDRYFILIGFPGMGGLFPYVDEYWSVADPNLLDAIHRRIIGEISESDRVTDLIRGIREWFRDVVIYEEELIKYHRPGLTRAFFDTFKDVQVYLPAIRSIKMEINRKLVNAPGYKVFLKPVIKARTWNKKYLTEKVDKEFYKDLCERMICEGMTPVLWQDQFTHDLSVDFAHRAVVVTEKNIADILPVMRASNLILDVFTDICRMAAVARAPYLIVEDRNKYMGLREYELDDLCVLNRQAKYIFSFVSILQNGRYQPLIDNVMLRLAELLPKIDREKFPDVSEFSSVVPYTLVREKKAKRIGAKFVKVPRTYLGI